MSDSSTTYAPPPATSQDPDAATATQPRLHDFGQIGFGVDVVRIQPTERLIELTYAKKQSFTLNGTTFLLPDQVVSWNPTPTGSVDTSKISRIMSTAREYQHQLGGRLGLGGPVEGIELSGEAKAANSRFSKSTDKTVLSLIEKAATFEFLRIQRIDYASALTPEVRDSLQAVLDSGTESAILRFYQLYGTHVLTEASLGGEATFQTLVKTTAQTSKDVVESSVNLDAEAEAEIDLQISGGIDFDQRSSHNTKVFDQMTSVSHRLVGGDVTAKNFDAWRKSLKSSVVPTADALGGTGRFGRHSRLLSTVFLGAGNDRYLGLVRPRLQPIYEVLGLDAGQQAEWKAAMETLLGNVSPFDDTQPRLAVDHLGVALGDGGTTSFEMGGWHETWEDHVGLEAQPFATAQVRVKTNSLADVWTHAKLYAGMNLQVRGKTPYWGDRYFIEVLSIDGDPEGRVWGEARKVAW